MDSKYANLPGIAHGEPDVYESSDLPESDQTRYSPQTDTSSAVEVIPVSLDAAFEKFGKARLDADYADFSDRILPRRHRGYVQSHGDWELVDRESENVVQKFRRLKCEFEELVDELKRCKELKPDEDLPAKLLPEAADLHDQLSRMNLEEILGAEKVAAIVDPNGAAKKKLLDGLQELRQAKVLLADGKQEGTAAAGGDCITFELYHLPEKESYQKMRRLCEIDERLSSLEKMVGTQTGTNTNVLNADVSGLPLTAAVKVLSSKLNLLDPTKLDMMEARAHALLHKVHEISDRSANATQQARDNAKVNDLYNLLKQTESVRNSLPVLVDRLVALKDVHEQASDCLSAVTEMDSVQKDIKVQIQLEHERLAGLEASVVKNVEMMQANVDKLEERLKALKK